MEPSEVGSESVDVGGGGGEFACMCKF